MDTTLRKSAASIQSVETSIALLEALASSREPLTLKELATAAHMNVIKAHRYAASFLRTGLLVHDELNDRYDLGPVALRMGLTALSRTDVISRARNRIPQWVREVGHTLLLTVWGSHGPTVIHREESARTLSVRLRPGDVLPILNSVSGMCFATWQPDSLILPLIDLELALDQTEWRVNSAAAAEALQDVRMKVRERNAVFATDILLRGISGYCVPVFDAYGQMVLGIVALGPSASFDTSWGGRVDGPLRTAASRLSYELGYSDNGYSCGTAV